MMPPSADLLQGTLDMLILRSIALQPEHGWAIAQRIQQVSNNVLTAAGRKQLEAELANWGRLTGAINLVLERI
jgi:PadR family transcriptional regulator PadR